MRDLNRQWFWQHCVRDKENWVLHFLLTVGLNATKPNSGELVANIRRRGVAAVWQNLQPSMIMGKMLLADLTHSRKEWKIWMNSGLGNGYSNCLKDLNSTFQLQFIRWSWNLSHGVSLQISTCKLLYISCYVSYVVKRHQTPEFCFDDVGNDFNSPFFIVLPCLMNLYLVAATKIQ